MRLVFMGTPGYAVPVLETLVSAGYNVVGAYTQPDKPRGRGRSPEPSPVKTCALQRGLNVFQPESLRREGTQAELASLHPDAIVVAAYGKILPSTVLSTPEHGCLNVHPSLLPKYRGPSPVATAILEGETGTGTSIILLDEGMDTGPILASRELVNFLVEETGEEETGEEVTWSLFKLGAELMADTLPRWLRGEIVPKAQDEKQATVTKKLEKHDGEADWMLPADVLKRRLRAFTPWPGLFTHWRGKIVKIISASVLPPALSSGQEPGLVIPLKDTGTVLGVVTGQGVLALDSVQMEGRRVVSSSEFLQGYPDFLGTRLPS